MKKFLFGLIATALFLGALSVNAQSSRTPSGYTALSMFRFGKISSYAGPCVDGGGFCSGSLDPNPMRFDAAVMKISENKVSYAFSREFYAANSQYLSNGLHIGEPFALPQSISSGIGIDGEFVVAPGNYEVTVRDNIYFITVTNM